MRPRSRRSHQGWASCAKRSAPCRRSACSHRGAPGRNAAQRTGALTIDTLHFASSAGTLSACSALRRLVALAAALYVWPAVQAAELSSVARKEVDQLLATVGNSRCEFYRAGTWHSAAVAQAHLEHKYQYLATRQMLSSTEDFIQKAATRSSLTGEAYAIRCQAMPAQPSATWLEAELRSLRSRAPAGAAPAAAAAATR